MNFHFDAVKATEAACRFLQREGGTMNIMKLVKLIYLLDRASIKRRGIPVVGGTYFSLPNGPITSELLDLINAGRLWGAEESRWEELISDRQNHEVGLLTRDIPDEHLAESEIALIDEIFEEHGQKDQWALRDWTHEHCPEWMPLEQSRDRIPVERMAEALGMSEEEISRLEDEIREHNALRSILR